jgi:hypothetical protein
VFHIIEVNFLTSHVFLLLHYILKTIFDVSINFNDFFKLGNGVSLKPTFTYYEDLEAYVLIVIGFCEDWFWVPPRYGCSHTQNFWCPNWESHVFSFIVLSAAA